MADTTISALTQALSAKMAGTAVIPLDDTDAVTKKSSLATLRTVMFAGSTGYTATDPLVAGTASFTTLAASSTSLLGAGVWPTATLGQTNSRVVLSSATENQLLTIINMNTAAGSAVGIDYGASIYLGARGTDATANMAFAEIFGARESAASGNLTSYLSFKTSNAAGARTEYLRISSAGAVTMAGTLAVTGTSTLTGVVGIGVAVSTARALYVGTTTLAGVNQLGLDCQPVFSSASTTSVKTAAFALLTASAAYSTTTGYTVFVDSPVLSNTAVTTIYGAYISNQGQAKSTNAYGVYIAAQSGAATTNIGLYNAGTTQLVGSVGLGGAATTTAALSITNATGLTGTSQYGIVSNVIGSSAGTSEGIGVYAAFTSAAAAYTVTNRYGIYIASPAKGAGSTITNDYGLYIAAVSQGGTLNYALKTAGGRVAFVGLPTSSAGLASGDIWANSNVLTIVP